MNAISMVMACFSLLGALDRILGNRFGLGREFEKGLMLLGNLALSVIGMIIVSPLLADLMQPAFGFVSEVLHIDPSIIPACLFANDMGGASLAAEVMVREDVGLFNAMIISSMMGCTISFTIPYALGSVEKRQQRLLLLGLLCGIVTIPVGCLIAGLSLRISIPALLYNLLPLILFSGVIALGLIKCPELCVKIFGVIGTVIKIIVTVGLALSIFRFLTGVELVKNLDTLEAGMAICLSCGAIMTGAFPMLYVISKLFAKPMKIIGEKTGIGDTAIVGFLSTLASSMTTFEMMKDMDDKGVMLNSAFAVSAAFALADHLAFTMAFREAYVPAMILGKLISGVCSLAVAAVVYGKVGRKGCDLPA